MPEEASLRDVTVAPNSAEPKAAEASEAKSAEKSAEVQVVDQSEKDALELGKVLLGSGYSKEQLNSLLEAPKALAGLQAVIRSGDGRQIVQMLRQSGDAASADRLEQTIADYYVEQYGGKDKGKENGKSADSELMSEVSALRDEVKGFRTAEQQRQAAAAMASTKQRYSARVDDIFSQDDIKGLGLSKSEEKGIRARLDSELASDPTIVQRVSNGNFVDVAPTLKSIFDERAAEIKAKTEADKQAREGVKSRANWSFPGGPAEIEVPAAAADSWDATEEALAKALERA